MKIVTKPSFEMIGIEVRAHWKELFEKMPEAWGRLFAAAGRIPHRKTGDFLEVSRSVENDVYTQLIGAEVEDGSKIPEGMKAVEIPEQQYIFHEHDGPVRDIASSFGSMYEWAKSENLMATEFKLDIGYKPPLQPGKEEHHKLYIQIL